jgi:glutamate-1-semialdehyde 2,1-aminomutase
MDIDGAVQRVGSLLSVIFGPTRVRNFAETFSTDTIRYATFFHAMLARAVHLLPPSPAESWFVSVTHTDADIAYTIECARSALTEDSFQRANTETFVDTERLDLSN